MRLDRVAGNSKRAGRNDLLPGSLAERLAEAADLRNILVHLYEDSDYEILASGGVSIQRRS